MVGSGGQDFDSSQVDPCGANMAAAGNVALQPGDEAHSPVQQDVEMELDSCSGEPGQSAYQTQPVVIPPSSQLHSWEVPHDNDSIPPL